MKTPDLIPGLPETTKPKAKAAPKTIEAKRNAARQDRQVLRIWEAWQYLFKVTRPKFSDKRVDRIVWALAEYGAEDTLRALRGYTFDDWEERTTKLGNHDLILLFRDPEHLERGLDMYRQRQEDQTPPVPIPELLAKITTCQEARRANLVCHLLDPYAGDDELAVFFSCLSIGQLTAGAYLNVLSHALTCWRTDDEAGKRALVERLRVHPEDPGLAEELSDDDRDWLMGLTPRPELAPRPEELEAPPVIPPRAATPAVQQNIDALMQALGAVADAEEGTA